MLPPVYATLRASTAVVSLVGTRIYRHGAAPQNVVAPYVTWFIVTGDPENELPYTPRIDRFQVQVDCWSNNTGSGDAQVEALAQAVRDAIEPTAYLVRYVVNERDFETQRYRIGMEFTWRVHRPAVQKQVYAIALSGDSDGGAVLLSGDQNEDGIDRELVS